jgi:D-beta-D-heptose 7-phosphate kinase / D-beta-D-heptose 1-phosphate adenosyltransferase
MRGLTIVTNGCFDLFHEGHKHLLEVALQSCFEGLLVVFINSNKSIQEIKGLSRPIDDIIIRASNVESFIKKWCQFHCEYPTVKVIFFNSEQELSEKIDFYQPNMIVKGDDRPDTREIIGSGKWPILIVPRLKDKSGIEYSTTRKAKE